MGSMIKGIEVVLHQKVVSGTDAMNNPTYREEKVTVSNVLVYPVDESDIVSDHQMYGKKAVYELCIPKGDTHNWEDAKVEFFGKTWQTYGFAKEYMEEMLPLDWNRKIRVERYG